MVQMDAGHDRVQVRVDERIISHSHSSLVIVIISKRVDERIIVVRVVIVIIVYIYIVVIVRVDERILLSEFTFSVLWRNLLICVYVHTSDMTCFTPRVNR